METHRRLVAVGRESGPRRPKARSGASLSNCPTAPATCASTSSGYLREARSKTRAAETGRPTRCRPTPYRSCSRRPPCRAATRSASSWRAGGSFVIAGGRGERGDERGQPAWEVGMEQVAGDDAYGRVRLRVERRAPGRDGVALVRPQPREPEVELHDRGVGVELRELLEPVERALGPARERCADLRLERIVLREERRRGRQVAARVQRLALREVARLGIRAESRARTRAAAGPRAASGVVGSAVVSAEPPSDETTATATTATAATATAPTRSATRRCADTAGR